MNCAHVRERLSELHDGHCLPGETEALRLHLADCAACRQQETELGLLLTTLEALPAEEPSPELRANFKRMLAEEIASEEAARDLANKHPKREQKRERASILAFPFWGQLAAAACLVLIGMLAGATLFRKEPPAPANTEATQKQLADLQGRLDSMSQLVAYSLSRQQPDNTRLQRVAAQVGRVAVPSSGELAALVGSLAFDPSTNVRLSALEALYPHSEQSIVREGVIASLPRERAPLVQLAMIDFLSSLRDAQANKAIEALIHESSTDERVREAARRALAVNL